MNERIRIGVSTCLLGEPVRYDGGHKHDRYITDVLGRYFDFYPVCPEVESGMSTPREAMRLEGDPAAPRLVTNRTGIDLTAQMESFVARKLEQLKEEDLCGFIFKSKSPSSGLFRVKVYQGATAAKTGSGLFAGAVARAFPHMPLEEEGRLNDPVLRENFLERVFALRRWKDFLAEDSAIGGLVAFHTIHKLQVMAHSPEHYRQMGKLVAEGKGLPQEELFSRYGVLYMEALARIATVRKNTNVLQHIAGYFKKQLTVDEKRELQEVIDAYHAGLTPLIVPITLLKHYVRRFGQEYLAAQTFLNPHPHELMLRNHV